jgi:hypothetical protein
MIPFSMISFLIGATLAQRFKVMVLMPATAIVLVVAVGIEATPERTVWSIVMIAIIIATCQQIGYLFGIVIRHVLLAALPQKSSALTSPEAPGRHAAH